MEIELFKIAREKGNQDEYAAKEGLKWLEEVRKEKEFKGLQLVYFE